MTCAHPRRYNEKEPAAQMCGRLFFMNAPFRKRDQSIASSAALGRAPAVCACTFPFLMMRKVGMEKILCKIKKRRTKFFVRLDWSPESRDQFLNGGMPLSSRSRSGEPSGLTRRQERKIIRFFLAPARPLDWKRRPISGISPRIG